MVTHITMRKSATDPLEVNHLCPLITHSSPSRTAVVAIRVGSAPGPGLGHGERTAELALEQGLEPSRALLVAPVGLDPHRQQLGVARVRRVVAEDDRCQETASQHLVQQAQPDLAEAHAPELGWQVGGPQALALHLLLQGADGLQEVVVVEVEGLEGQDLLVHEGARPGQLGLVLRFGLEVPRHCLPPVRAPRGRPLPCAGACRRRRLPHA